MKNENTDNILNEINQELNKEGQKVYTRRRLLTIFHYLNGMQSSEISKLLGISTRTIQRHISAFNELGPNYLHKTSRPGNIEKLTQEQMVQLKEDIKKGPLRCGYFVADWTALVLRKHIKKLFHANLSLESCRKILASNQRLKVKQNPMEQRKIFKETLSKVLNDDNTDIWVIMDIYLGRYRGGKNSRGLYPYLEEDLVKTEEEIKAAKIDLEEPAHKVIVLCSKNLKTHEFVYHYKSKYEKEEQAFKSVLEVILKRSSKNEVVLFISNNSFSKKSLAKITNKKAKRNIQVCYLPPYSQELHPLKSLKKQLLSDLKLIDKRNKRATVISQQKKQKIIRYLEQLRKSEDAT
ncbi:helix-turn-helix domain-containing protein [uncultured Brevibacillus sp.]|uniref:helix-turn-helix domain-containing protein n=1 Tax=uncultured Brevibacillus sp. TaxID=169970 RepID=UPI00259275B0|nr:helix-turn-helix domain-containing protein [uncultured Brevibacillus sp.]